MSNPKCEYCKQTYSTKYSLKAHYTRCKEKVKFENEQQMKEVAKKRFDEEYIEQEKMTLNDLPTEILCSIGGFLFDKKDEYCSYRQFYKNYLNVCLVSKRFYNIFYPKPDKIINYMENVSNEANKIICKSTAKNDYNLKETELDEINCEYVKNPHYSSSAPMRLYKIADILDFLANKYGSKKLYDDFIKREEKRKEDAKTKREIMKDKRKVLIKNLFEKYAITTNSFNNLKNTLEDDYYTYINSGSPGIKTIEQNIKDLFIINDKKNSIEKRINNARFTIEYELNIIDEYLYKNNKSEDEVFDIINQQQIRLNNLKQEFKINGLNYNNEINKYNEKHYINEYVYKNHKSIEFIIEYILGKINRKNELEAEFAKHELNFNEYNRGFNSNNTKIISYIDYNNCSIEDVINPILEMIYYNKHTNYKNEYNLLNNKNYYENERIKLAKDNSLKNFIDFYSSKEEFLANEGSKIPAIVIKYINNNYERIKNRKDTPTENSVKKNKTNNSYLHSNKCNDILCIKIGSPVCGYCVNCCNIDDCRRHKKKNNAQII